MLMLLQMINRMIYLEYTKEEVQDMLDTVKDGHMSVETLFTAMNCEIPTAFHVERFENALFKSESAIVISFLKRETN